MARKKTKLDTSPELAFVKKGILNVVVHRGKEEMEPLSAETMEFLEDTRVVRISSMDQVNFKDTCVFKVTLDFTEPIECVEETAVRESTDWVLCSCSGANAFYSKIESRLVLQSCTVSTQSTVEELLMPFVLVMYFDDDEWLVERVLR